MRKALGLLLVLIALVLGYNTLVPYCKESAQIEVSRDEVIEDIKEQITVEEETEVVELNHGDVVCNIMIPQIELDDIVYTNEEDNYYLHRDKDGYESTHGELYMNKDSNIIFGHNMNDDTKFGRLDELGIGSRIGLQDLQYSNMLYTEYEVIDYMVLNQDKVMEYITHHESDLILVTCNGNRPDGRLVVICKEIK